MSKYREKLKELNYKLVATGLFGILLGTILFVLAYKVGPSNKVYPVTLIVCLAGAVLGWLIGIVSTPYNSEDESQIENFTKLIGTFFTGYLLSKLDRLMNEVITIESLSSIIGTRIILFICFFCLSWIIVFSFRQYANAE